MPSFTAPPPAWPDPLRFALALTLAFSFTLIAAWVWGQALIEALLPLAHTMLGWIDDRFGILFLGVDSHSKWVTTRQTR